MTEAAETAGTLLRVAREKQGLHIAALATMLKVPPRKLEALEADRYEEFQGATFVRALAQAACRTLKIDPVPVLERLPEQDTGTLSQLEHSLNMPFRERGTRRDSAEVPLASQAVMGIVLLLVVGALAFWLWPAGWHLPSLAGAPSGSDINSGTVTTPLPVPAPAPIVDPASGVAQPTGPGASVPSTGQVFPQPGLPPVASASSPAMVAPAPVPAPASVPALVAPAPSAAIGQGALQLRARQSSWVEVVDARSQVLVSRTLAAGETVEFDGALPLRVKIGNAGGTELTFRGRPVDLNAISRDNVARLELK
ncbi:RodZ domain-containing protein [Ideonella sp. YS5]|uniref:helix-turn-helix domain-containing protein n=1 Tax=Ideonella sp. YS5 TaxID=3453714 RepID=UPI003EE859F7